ncbi:pyruvate kinase [bacterium]|nr:pyruvate kinase [bacterium]
MKDFSKTKIIATLGPSTSTYDKISELIFAGASAFRLNTSHSREDDHVKNIQLIRTVSASLKSHIPIILDLQGPKIRVGNISEAIEISKGDILTLEATDNIGNKNIIPVDYEGIAQDVSIGSEILLDDGKIGLEVVKIVDQQVQVKVKYGSLLKPRKGINIPGTTSSLCAITQRDIEFIRLAVEFNIDYIALSFVRDANDIELAKRYIKNYGGNIPIIAKIEKPQAIKNIDSILKITDGIMIARGDLGIETQLDGVPAIQKQIILKAINARKISIVATQMLESMIEEPIPTRAEVSDVANAILDGADAIMLSGETATGKYPIEAVKVMKQISSNSEYCKLSKCNLNLDINDDYDLSPQAIANAAVKMAQDINAKAILSFTHSGYTTRLLSKLKPTVPIIAITDSESTARCLNLCWGTTTDQKNWDDVLDSNLLEKIDDYILKTTDLKKGERIVIAGSIPKLITGRTNFVRIHRIGATT